MFGKQMFAGPCRDKGTRSSLLSLDPVEFPHPASSIFSEDVSVGGSSPGTGPLCEFSRQLEGRPKFLPESLGP